MKATLGAQLYTVRDALQTDAHFAEAMARIRAIGYESVQVSGIGPLDWAKMRTALDDNGLTCKLTHVGIDTILDDPDGVAERHQVLGCDTVGIGSGGPFLREAEWTLEGFDQLMHQLTEAGRLMADRGLKFAYHNHHMEFRRLPDGRLFMDAMLARIPEPLMGLTLDVYWLQYGGMPIPEAIERYGDRTLALHLKDYRINDAYMPEFAEVGQGTMPWASILEIAEAKGIGFHAVEQDTCPGDPFESLKMSYDYLAPFYA